MQISKKHSQSGQVGLITLLIMAVVLTIAISLSQRTAQQQDASFIQDESTRVFNAAESGVEEALFEIYQAEMEDRDPAEQGILDFDDDTVSYSVSGQSTFEMFVGQGNTVQIPVNGTDNMVVNWWDRTDNCTSPNPPPAIIISIFKDTIARHFGFDPCETDRNTDFAAPGSGAGDYSYEVLLPIAADDILIRIKPLFNSTNFNISSGAIALAQYDVESTGFNEDEGIARTIEVKRSLPSAYSFMDYALVSGSSLTK